MKLRTLLCLTMLAFGSLACSGLGAGLTDGIPAATLTEPWSSMDLPLDGGKVVHSDATSLSVMYSGDKVKELGPKYRAAFEAAGFEKITELDNDESFVLSYKHDGKQIGAALTFAAGNTVAGLTYR